MKTILTVCAFTFCIAPALRAQGTPKAPPQGNTTKTMTSEETFQWYDANSDGFLTREEIIARPIMKSTPAPMNEKMADIMMKKDANGDGKISKQEWSAAGESGNEARFARFDTDKDGTITKEEFLASPVFKRDPAKAEELFKGYDKDGDGKITKAEWMGPAANKSEAPKGK